MGIWLILLGVGAAALASYTFSPKAHAWIDDHLHSLRMLWAAIRASQHHVDQAEAATDPAVAAAHATKADEARREAERQAAIAVSTAQTEKERVAAQQAADALAPLLASVDARLARLLGSSALPPGDAHDRATEKAVASHGVAAAELDVAKEARARGDKATAVTAAAAADAANRAAAAHTGAMALTAQTDARRAAAAGSAATVEKRSAEVADIFAQLGGVGICDVKTYAGVTARAKDTLLAQLRADSDYKVTGNDPWVIEGPLGVKLKAAWDSRSRMLKIIVTDGDKSLCPLIWLKIDPHVKEAIARGA